MNGVSFGLVPAQALVLVGLLYVTSCVQALSALMAANQRAGSLPAFHTAYELLLAAHLAIMAMLANSVAHAWEPAEAVFWFFGVPIEALLWVNAGIACMGLVACIRTRRAAMAFELCVLLSTTPPLAHLLGDAFSAVLIVDAAFFLARTGFVAVSRICCAGRQTPWTAPIEAIQAMPEGIAFSRLNQAPLIVNAAMRSFVKQLGFSVDLLSMHETLDALKRQGTPLAIPGTASDRGMPEKVPRLVELPDGRACLFAVKDVRWRAESFVLLVGMDVTEEWRLQEELRVAQEQLRQAEQNLKELIADVHLVARREALAKMQQRVHDVIGLRLSLLHRPLEEGDLTEERIAQMTQTIRAMMLDLAERREIDPAVELAAITDAFASGGIVLHVQGDLSGRVEVDRVFIDAIREAASNAVRHSHASCVWVTLSQDTRFTRMRVHSDGAPVAPCRPEGTGLCGMREAVHALGGELSVTSRPHFSLDIVVPSSANAT